MIRRTRLFSIAAIVLVLTVAGCTGSSAPSDGTVATVSTAPTTAPSTNPSTNPSTAPSTEGTSTGRTSPSAPSSTTTASAGTSAARLAATSTLNAAVARYPAGAVSVAAVDTVTGRRVTAGARDGIWLASTYKLVVLEGLLLRRQDSGSSLTGGEIELATRAIEHSDNAAGYQLFLAAGGNSGLVSAARRLGATHLEGGVTDPAFTRTGAPAFLHLLRALIEPGPLSSRSRAFVRGLMRNVEADQRWGVGAASENRNFANKNGWVAVDNDNAAGEDDDGRWIAGSVGIVTVGGHRVLMAVLTQHQRSYDAGVDLVERLAKLTAAAVR